MTLQRRLEALIDEHGVPGAVVGVLAGEDLTVCAAGVRRRPGGPPVTPDTGFLIASITKVWTATLVMQLVDEGRIELDAPANRYLDPPLRLADAEVADAVTVRQLLTHSGGFYGDADEPPDRGDDAVRRTVETYGALQQLHRPGALFSYCNAGYNVLGRIVECLTGGTWDRALRDRILDPLGLDRTFTMPEEAMVHPIAVGHERVRPDSLELTPVSRWLDGRGGGPCGGTLSTTASDLLAFARMHIRDGLGPDGRRVLSEQSAPAMRRPWIDQPDPSLSAAWGLGWGVERRSDPVIVEHGGNTSGQQSELVVVPEHELALCVLTNGDVQGQLRRHVLSELLGELIGVERPDTPAPAPAGATPALTAFVGSFSGSDEVRIEVTEADGALQAAFVTDGDTARVLPSFTAPLTYAGGTTFLVTMPPMTVPITATFLSEDGAGVASHVAVGLRVAPRIGAPRA